MLIFLEQKSRWSPPSPLQGPCILVFQILNKFWKDKVIKIIFLVWLEFSKLIVNDHE